MALLACYEQFDGSYMIENIETDEILVEGLTRKEVALYEEMFPEMEVVGY